VEIEQDRKAKVTEPDGVLARKPGTHRVAEQEPRAVADGSASALVAVPKVADAVQVAAVGEEDKTRITNNEQMNDED